MAKLNNVDKKRMRNRSVRSSVKTVMARAESAIAAGQTETGREAVNKAVSALDKAAKKGVIHPNKAARGKSRLTRKLNQAEKSKG